MKDKLKTCSKTCASRYRSALTKKAIADGRCIVPLRDRPELREAQSRKIKKAYEEGRMEHMKEVWKGASERWLGEKNPKFQNGEYNGYKMVKVEGTWIPEHRWIVEKYLGRPLLSSEIVHHKNGNKLDNRLENLQVMTASEHARLHRRNDTIK